MAGYSVLGPSTESGEVVDFQQCDRQCRWKYGFFDRAITGVRVGYFGNRNSWGQHCTCYKSGKQLGEDAGVPHVSTKSWDTADFWCGPGDGSGFVTKLVCARDGHGMKTMTRNKLVPRVTRCCTAASVQHAAIPTTSRSFLTRASRSPPT